MGAATARLSEVRGRPALSGTIGHVTERSGARPDIVSLPFSDTGIAHEKDMAIKLRDDAANGVNEDGSTW